MTFTIFYAWQSDRDESLCKDLIREALDKAATELKDELRVDIMIDQDTQDVPGSPSITDTILKKIRENNAVVVDLTLTHILPADEPCKEPRKRAPNPNALFEYAYAIRESDRNVIAVMNQAFGGYKELPFDIQQRRCVGYCATEAGEESESTPTRTRLAAELKNEIRPIVQAAVEPEISDDEEAVRLNPGNGRRVVRLIMRASTEREVDDFYGDFKSAPHKTSESDVFAAYVLKKNRLLNDDQDDVWWRDFDEEAAKLENPDEVLEALERLEKKYPDDS